MLGLGCDGEDAARTKEKTMPTKKSYATSTYHQILYNVQQAFHRSKNKNVALTIYHAHLI